MVIYFISDKTCHWYKNTPPISKSKVFFEKSNNIKFDQFPRKNINIYNTKSMLLDTSWNVFSYGVHIVL